MPFRRRHADVEDQQIGPVLLAQPQRIETVGGFADDRHVRLGFEQRAHAAADDAVIVS